MDTGNCITDLSLSLGLGLSLGLEIQCSSTISHILHNDDILISSRIRQLDNLVSRSSDIDSSH